MRKFKIGEKVKFKDISHYMAPSYTTDIPNIIHGNTELDSNYYDTHGVTIIGTHCRDGKVWYIIRFKDKYEKFVQLGFKEETLEPLKITNWRERLS